MKVFIVDALSHNEYEAEERVLGVCSEFERCKAPIERDIAEQKLKTFNLPQYAVRVYEVDGRQLGSYYLRANETWETQMQRDDGTWHITDGVIPM